MGEPIPGKGALLTKMALFWFDKLQGVVPNHLTGDDPLAAVATDAERAASHDCFAPDAAGAQNGDRWRQHDRRRA